MRVGMRVGMRGGVCGNYRMRVAEIEYLEGGGKARRGDHPMDDVRDVREISLQLLNPLLQLPKPVHEPLKRL